MSALQTLRILIRATHADERQLIRAYLLSFDRRGDEFVSKSVMLYNYLCKESAPEKERDVEHFVYGKRDTTAWPKLLTRLRDKMLDALCLPVNTSKRHLFDERSRRLFNIHRKLMRAQLLFKRNCLSLADLEIEDILEHTQKIEAWEERLIALLLRMEMLRQWPEMKQPEINRLTKQLMECRLFIRQNTLVERLLFETDNGALITDTVLSEELKRVLEKPPKDYSQAALINYEQLRAYYFTFILHQPSKAVHCLHKATRLLKKNPLVKPHGYEGLIGVRLAETLLHNKRYRFAAEEALLSMRHLAFHPYAKIRAYDVLFFSQCYRGDFHEAREVIEMYDGLFPLNTVQRFCWMGYVYFAIGSFERAEEMIDKMLAAKPRAALTPGMQLLALMNAVELAKESPDLLDVAEKRFRKMKVELNFDREAFPREAVMRDILFLLRKNGFDFKETYQATASSLLEQLRTDHRLKWRFLSDELLPFEAWFMGNVLKQDREQMCREAFKGGRVLRILLSAALDLRISAGGVIVLRIMG